MTLTKEPFSDLSNKWETYWPDLLEPLTHSQSLEGPGGHVRCGPRGPGEAKNNPEGRGALLWDTGMWGGGLLGDPKLGVAGADPQVSLTSPQTVSQLQHLEPPLGL